MSMAVMLFAVASVLVAEIIETPDRTQDAAT